MSSSHRNLARLPLDIFENLQYEQTVDATAIRASICAKLRQPPRNDYEVKAPITAVGSFLKISLVTLMRILDPLLTYEECSTLRARICQYCAPPPLSALAVLTARKTTISTGMNPLDMLLKGGFRVGTISELVGAPGAGKTQLAMQLCVMAARHGFGTTYIDTEKKLSLERLREIAHTRAFGEEDQDNDGGFLNGTEGLPPQDGYKPPSQVLHNIVVHSPSSTKDLLAVIQSTEEEILLRNDEALDSPQTKFPVHLFIVDSIAAPTRRDFGADSAIQRVGLLMQIASLLKRLADQLQLAVVVINQVGSSSGASSGIYQEVQAALGHSWAHCLSTRVAMEQEVRDVNEGGQGWRRATVVKSNVVGNDSINYAISNQGIIESNYFQGEEDPCQ